MAAWWAARHDHGGAPSKRESQRVVIYLEDMKVGERVILGRVCVERDEALDFARKYDPQPFHLEEAAATGHAFFKRLSISGWQTCCHAMRLIVDEMRERQMQSLGSPGVDQLRWTQPVYPGDVLTLEAETIEVRPSRSRPDMGSAKRRFTFRNQDGAVVMTMDAIGLMARRPARPQPEQALDTCDGR